MKGTVSVVVKDSRNSYSFELKRNITVLSGDSGKGKTTLFEMVYDYNRYGKNSGTKIICNIEVIAVSGRDWRDVIENTKKSVIIIDEDNKFVRSKEFAEVVKKSDCYFLLITRGYLEQLPISVDEIYEISGSKNKKFKKIYKDVERMYDNPSIKYLPFKPEVLITEDSKSGYQFFIELTKNTNIECVSADGKSNIIKILDCYKDKNVLVVADGAAFGAEIRDIVTKQKLRSRKLAIFLPESFEWLILSSGLVCDSLREDIIIPEKYVDSKKYFSWERYFTSLLVSVTKDMQYKKYPANKNKLPDFYKHEKSIETVKKNMSRIDFT